MSNPESRKHLSLLESLNPEAGEEREKSRLSRRGAESTGDSRGRRREQSANDSEGPEAEHQNDGELVPLPIGLASSAPHARSVPEEPGEAAPAEELRFPTSEAPPAILPVPQRARGPSIGGIVSFLLCVVLPVVAASVYYIAYASNQFVAEFKYSVRDASTATSTSDATSSLSAMLGVSSSMNPTENYMVADYLTSRQAVEDLQRKIDIKKLFSRSSVDWWSRFDEAGSMEDLVKYWQYMTTSQFDQITGIAVAQVRAFSAEDAFLISKTMVSLAEDLINEVAQRPQREAIGYAEDLVKRAQDNLTQVRERLTKFRNEEAIIDPNSSLVLTNATLAQSLRTQVLQYKTDLISLQKQKIGANSTQVQNLQVRIKATEEQIAAVEAEVKHARGTNSPLSEVMARYEQLDLERQFAQNNLNSTMQSLEQARANGMAKRVFITPYVRPALPQESEYPNRPVAILTVAGACFLLWTVALLVVRSIREHLA